MTENTSSPDSDESPVSIPGQAEPVNVYGEALQPCSSDPLTGFYRDGCCNTGAGDHGSHTVCVAVTADFLSFSRSKGNDLTTAVPAFNFPGLSPGDHWCLCAARWLEAEQAGCAPRVYLASTHRQALETIPLSLLQQYATDLN